MTTTILIAGVVIILLFGFVVLFGAPYLPTLKKQVDAAFDLLDLKPGQTLLELGCGDGRVLKAAAQRGLSAVGYELNPLLVCIAKLHTWRYRKQAKVVWGNFWTAKWPKTDAIFVFLLARYMKKLDTKIVQELHGWTKSRVLHLDAMQGKAEQRTEPYMQYGEGAVEALTPQRAKGTGGAGDSATRQAGAVQQARVKLVSFAFKVPGKTPTQVQNGLYLYMYR
jgi:SAM-dependent methyltransferase